VTPQAEATEALRKSVRELVQPQQRRVRRLEDDGTTRIEWATVRSLLSELRISVGSTSTAGETKGKGGGGLLDLSALDLYHEMRATARTWLRAEGLPRRGGKLAAQLQLLAAHTWATEDAEHLADVWGSYGAQARAILVGEVTHRDVRGVPCPECGYVLYERHDAYSLVRVPNLRVDLQHSQVRAIWCRACWATWWRGDQLGALYEQLIELGAIDPLAPIGHVA
jgi:hypothetical protein